MQKTFYWYDLETSGTEPRWDRIVQFAGMRTDMELNPVGEEFVSYFRLPEDVLPDPVATTVTGITPAKTFAEGISEFEGVQRIHEIFSQPGSCVVGYNSLRFDDEFVRFAFYRHLHDPYAREWQNGSSRWDLIDLVRATGALRREGIEWPRDEEGLPVYRLEALTKANGIAHESAHDAMSDVRATAALARLIKERQPKLFAYYLKCRYKKEVRSLLEPYGARLCVHVTGMYPRHRFGVAPIMSVCRHPTNSNSVVVIDLAEDIEPLIDGSEAELKKALFTAGAEWRPPLKEVRINRCPFVADFSVLTDENIERLEIDQKAIQKRARRLKSPGLLQKIYRLYEQPRPPKSVDVDAALYDGFLQDDDRSRCRAFHEGVAAGQWPQLDYRDKRLTKLVSRLKARSFAERQSPEEVARWQEFVRSKLQPEGDVPWRTLERFHRELDELAEAGTAPELVRELGEYGAALRARYGSETATDAGAQ